MLKFSMLSSPPPWPSRFVPLRDRLSKGGNIANPIFYDKKLSMMILENDLQHNYPLTPSFK